MRKTSIPNLNRLQANRNIINQGKQVLALEAKALESLSTTLDDNFVKTVKKILSCKGKLIFTGMGKAGIVAQKISGTFSSLGHPSFFMHPAEAGHGDLGMVGKLDLVFFLSNSGNTVEITTILPFIKEIGSVTISITGNRHSYLFKNADIPLWIGNHEEACGLGLAPTTSTTLMIALGDALAVSVLKQDKHFNERRFAFNHPGGALGKKLTQVDAVMRKDHQIVVLSASTPVAEVVVDMTKACIGSAVIVDRFNKVLGIFSDGDLRRLLEKRGVLATTTNKTNRSDKSTKTNKGIRTTNFLALPIKSVMNNNPQTIIETYFVVDALNMMSQDKIGEIPVISKTGQLVGVLCLKDLV